MALTRKMLKAMGIEDEKAEQIIEAHSESVNALKAERDDFKENASKYEKAQKELDELKAAAEKGERDPYKEKYEELKAEFDTYKGDVEAKETRSAKEKAYRSLLKLANVGEKYHDRAMKAASDDINSIELDKDGNAKNADKLTEKIKTEWSDCIINVSETGANTPNPPANSGSKMTRAEIYAKGDNGKYKLDTAERQKALAEVLRNEGGT